MPSSRESSQPGIKPTSPALADGFFTTNATWDAHTDNQEIKITKEGFSGWVAIKDQPTNAGDIGSIPGQEDPLEKEMATHSSILTWEIPWTEEPGGLWCMQLQRIGHDLGTKQQEEFEKKSQ